MTDSEPTSDSAEGADFEAPGHAALAEACFDRGPSPMALVGGDGTILRANAAFADAFERSGEDLAGSPAEALLPRDAIEALDFGSGNERPRGGREASRTYMDHPEWGIRYWDWHILPLTPAGVASPVALLSLHDVTQKVRDRDDLLGTRRRLRALASRLALVEESERRRIAQEIHDGLGHGLAAVKMLLSRALAEDDRELSMEAVSEARDLVTSALKQTSRLSFQLSPPVLYDLGLPAALEWLAEQMSQQHQLHITVDDRSGEVSLGFERAVTLYQAAKELLMNCVKHAKGSRVEILTRRGAGSYMLEIRDDGVGFDVLGARLREEPGFGLFSIRERVTHLDGSLDIYSRPGDGTRVVIGLPMTADPEGEVCDGDSGSPGG
ncbi:MAG: PAS domain-containing protein [Armatimonadia bacterium]|nr:PAS domain-containing protein [Armatimonadia bacterium]